MRTPCAICPNQDRHLWGKIVQVVGSKFSPVLFIGEKPGYQEHSAGIPFIGKSGLEFNKQYLPLAGLKRYDVSITNACRCFDLNGGDNPTKEQARTCAEHHLTETLEGMPNLKVLVPMGGIATSLFPELKTIDIQHGFGTTVDSFMGVKGPFVVHPTLHPAGGLHKPETIRQLREDFKSLGTVLGTNKPIEATDWCELL